MELVRLATSIMIFVFIGWNILYLISRRDRLYLLETVFISYGLGIGFVSFEMLLFHLFNLKFGLARILIPWVALFFINLIIYLKFDKHLIVREPLPTKKTKYKFLYGFLILAISFEVFYAFFRALIKPIEAYDAIAIYGIKAKIFYLAHSIPEGFFKGLVHLFPHPDYPLNIPLAETFVYIFLGSLNDQLVKVLFPLYFIGILSIIYFAIRRFANSTYALLFTFTLASVPQFNAYAGNAYVDLVLAYYVLISAIFLFRWLRDRSDTQSLFISGLMAAFAGWTKNEGLMYCAINIVSISLFIALSYKRVTRKEILSLFVYSMIILLVSLPWAWVKKEAQIVNTEIDIRNLNPFYLVKELHKIGPIIYEFQKQFFGPKKWNILWPIAFFIIIFNYKKAFSGSQRYIALFLFLAVSGYVLSYMASYLEIRHFLSLTWSRFLIHFAPLVIYWMASILKEDLDI